jgi:PadR family transcriptional regulator, regulatory protein AphA
VSKPVIISEKPYSGSLSPEYALLGLLAIKPDHGYDLYQRLVLNLGQVWHISLSQTYNILNRLKTQGFVTETRLDQEKRPSRRQFHLTPTGLLRLQKWLDTPTRDSVRAIRVEFTTRLYFTNLIDPPKAHGLIETQIAKTQAGLKRLYATLEELPPEQIFNRLGLELRISQLDSILAWLERCHAALPTSTWRPSI